jgi:hypothetical protein
MPSEAAVGSPTETPSNKNTKPAIIQIVKLDGLETVAATWSKFTLAGTLEQVNLR